MNVLLSVGTESLPLVEEFLCYGVLRGRWRGIDRWISAVSAVMRSPSEVVKKQLNPKAKKMDERLDKMHSPSYSSEAVECCH